MCLAIPGRVVEIEGTDALVDFGGNRLRVAATFTPEARCGDWVLVHAGFAITIVDEAEAVATWHYLRQEDRDEELREVREEQSAESTRAS